TNGGAGLCGGDCHGCDGGPGRAAKGRRHMIEIDGIRKGYDGVPVVADDSFTIKKGDICVVVGTSGSGKTTLMRMINRLVEPTSGSVRIDGRDTREFIPYELRRQIGYVIQGNGLFPHRSVAQNIATVPQLLGWNRA